MQMENNKHHSLQIDSIQNRIIQKGKQSIKITVIKKKLQRHYTNHSWINIPVTSVLSG